MTQSDKELALAGIVLFGILFFSLFLYVRISGGPVATVLRQEVTALRQEAIERGCAGYNRITGDWEWTPFAHEESE